MDLNKPREEQIEAGAQALMEAFPTLLDDSSPPSGSARSPGSFWRPPLNSEPTEMAGVAEAETQAAYAWALDDGVDDLPTQRLTPRRVTALALALAVSLVLIAVAGAVALWTHRQPGPAHVAAAPPAAAPTVAPAVVLPDEPPLNSGCSGAVIGHSDVKHPQLGMVRVFLFFDGSLSTGPRSAGCALPVTHTGRVLPAIGVDAFVGNGFGFANPATDATGNMFIKYRDASNGNYSDGGVVVLIPNTDGFENVISYIKMLRGSGDGYFTGVNDYYSVELIGPVDGVYTIRQTDNTCDPSCASGSLTVRNLHWDGRGYVPDTAPPPPPPVTMTVQAPPPLPTTAESSPAQTGCVEGSTKYSPDSGNTYTCENGKFHEGPYGYQGGG